MKIRKLLSALKYKLRKDRYELQNSTLCGRELKVLPNTIRNKVDQDDAWFFYLAKHHKVIYDIGANVGYTALLAMLQNPNRPYVLVDPNPQALGRAAINMFSNGLGTKAVFFPAFVGDKDGEEVKFYTMGSGAAGSMHASHAESAAALNSFMKVATVTSDSLFQFYDWTPDLVKIDVEGAELLVLEGAKQMVRESQSTLMIEMHTMEDLSMEAAGNKVIEWATEMNYKVWYLKTKEALSNAAPIKDRGKCHLLLLPQEKPFPEYLTNIAQGAALPKI